MDPHGLLYLIRLKWERRLWLQEGTGGHKPPDKLSSSWTDRGSQIPAWGQLCKKHHILRTLSSPPARLPLTRLQPGALSYKQEVQLWGRQ